MPKWKFVAIFFDWEGELERRLAKAVDEAQEEGFDFHDVRFAQSSASNTGMSALLVLRKV